jgi:hypothetical protein
LPTTEVKTQTVFSKICVDYFGSPLKLSQVDVAAWMGWQYNEWELQYTPSLQRVDLELEKQRKSTAKLLGYCGKCSKKQPAKISMATTNFSF